MKDFIMASGCSIARTDPSTSSSEKLQHKSANLNHGGNERSHRHRVRRNRLSRPPHRSASALSRIFRLDRVKASGSGHRLFGPDDPQLQSVGANIHDERSVADALAGAYGVVNAVSLYVEHGQETFHSVHVESGQRVAAQAHRAGVDRLIHISGIGADATSQSRYIRKRGEDELAVRTAFVEALIVRPAVMFGSDDAFLTTILKLLHQLPVYPMFGRGVTRLQPAYVEDVAEAIGRTMQRAETPSAIFEFGGPRVYSYEEFLRAVAHQAGLAPRLIPIPLAVWHALAWASEMLPSPLLTRNQVELMQIDTVSSPEMPGFVELGISPHSVEAILQKMLSNCG